MNSNNSMTAIDSIIERLLSVRGEKPGRTINLKEDEIKLLIEKTLVLFKDQKTLIEIEASIKICGIELYKM
jgi:serine/threonine-protein phosphatase PP1 catalytic subunit